MDGLLFRTIREGLGLTRPELEKEFQVQNKTLREWERGSKPIPPAVAKDMQTRMTVFLHTIDKLSADDPVVDASTREGRVLAWAALIAYDKVTIEGNVAA